VASRCRFPGGGAGRSGSLAIGSMTAIWFILAAMTAAAVLGLLWPMSRRAAVPTGEVGGSGLATETAFYEDQVAEIDRDLERGLIAPDEAETAKAEADRQAARGGADELMKAVGQIEARLARDPNDARGWAVLAPVYMRTGRFDDAARAYANIARIKGETPDLLADQAEALTAAGNGTVSPEAKALFEKAQAKDPNAPKPRFYLARAAEQAGDTGEAIRQLTELDAASPPNAPWLGVVKQSLARLKGEPPPPATPQAAPKLPAEQQAAIRGMVDGLDARLKAGGGTPDEWLRLVRSRVVLGENDQAASALARARVALAGDPQGLAQVEQGARAVGLGGEGETPGSTESGQAGPAAPAEKDAAMAAMRAMPQAEQQAAIRGMVDGLDRRLAARGGTPDDWLRLVRSYSALGERDQAVKALDRARMALAANGEAVARLDGLARELDLPGKANP